MPGAFALRPTATGRRKRAPGPSPTKAGMVIPRVNASDFSLFLYPYTPKYHSSKFSLPDQTDSAVDCTGPRSGGLWSPRGVGRLQAFARRENMFPAPDGG